MLQNFVNEVLDIFNENLNSVIQYGSSIYTENNTDIDLIIVLNNKKIKRDLIELKLLKEKYSNLNLDLQLIYFEEVFSSEYFSIYNHGNYILDALKSSIVLYGNNPFSNLQLRLPLKWTTLYNQNQLYIFRARQEFIGYTRRSDDNNSNFHYKKLIYIMQDILCLEQEDIPPKEHIINLFKQKYPDIFSDQEWELFDGKSILTLGDALELYEALYSLSIQIVKKLDDKVKVKRINIDDMITEFVIASPDKVIILLDGLPSIPDQKYIINELVRNGYSVFFPRYLGTWESKGKFLQNSPIKEINSLIDKLQTGLTTPAGDVIKFKEINLISTSFGGAIGLSIQDSDFIKSNIALSPVTDFTLIDMKGLGKFLSNMFSGAYRFEQKDWEKLSSGKILSPMKMNYKNQKKYLILGGMGDPEVTPEQLEKFANKNKLKMKLYDNQKHISFSKLKDDLLTEVLLFLNKNEK